MLSQQSELMEIDTQAMVERIFSDTLHSKTKLSIANAALGVIASGSLIIHRIGRGLALATELDDKHTIKQVDRLLSNKKFDVWELFTPWVEYVIGSRKEINVTMDWTDFDLDKQATICLNLVTTHGRATPLLWKTVPKTTLKNNRNNHEDEILCRLKAIVANEVKVTIIADRGFCDTRLMEFLTNELSFDYIIRIRNNVKITDAKGEMRSAKEWIGTSSKTKTIKNCCITYEGLQVATVACTHQKGMKQAWCIASSKDQSGSWLVKWYAKRWGCEPQFRDTKDMHFGLGLSNTHISRCDRRDRILFVSAIATVLLTLLGAAGEKLGLDRLLKANTVKRRTLSLFNQGCIYYNRMGKMEPDRLEDFLFAFAELLAEARSINTILAVI
jgi:hypothetical protein